MLNQLDAHNAFEFYKTFLEWYCKWAHPRYLEIGCNRGETCWRLYKYCISIDAIDVLRFPDWNEHAFKFPDLRFHECTSDQYFSILDEDTEYDLIFIDGDHSKEQVFSDVMNSLRY